MDKLLQETAGYRVTLTDMASDADRQFLSDRLKAFNNEISPYHKAIRTEGMQPLDIFIRDADGAIAGGLAADTYWGWLAVEDLWIAPALRRHGFGRALLLAAEAEAIGRGCLRALLTTYSFQARGFYEKLGYRVVGQLDDYPPGQSYFWMRKDFARHTEEHI